VVQLALFRGSYSAILIFSVVFWLRRVRVAHRQFAWFSLCVPLSSDEMKELRSLPLYKGLAVTLVSYILSLSCMSRWAPYRLAWCGQIYSALDMRIPIYCKVVVLKANTVTFYLYPYCLRTVAKLAGRLLEAELFVRLPVIQLINKMSSPVGEQIHVILITWMYVMFACISDI
jgi:hypothetical protein